MSIGIEFLIVLGTLTALVFLPGVLLTYWLFPGKHLDFFERIPIGFGLVCGLLAGLFFLARTWRWDWTQFFAVWIAAILLEAVVTFVLPRARWWQMFPQSHFAQGLARALPRTVMYDEQKASQPAARILVGFFVVLLGLSAWLTHIGPNEEDHWSYFWVIRNLADAVHFAPVSLGDRNVVHSWWLIHAAIVRAGNVDLVRLGQDWMPLLFVPMSFLAFYALARVLFLSRNLALVASFLQFGFLFADLFNPDEWIPWPGWWLIARSDQDHTAVIFVFLPVFAALLVWYLREGGWALLGATIVSQVGMLGTHAKVGFVLSALIVFSVLLIELLFVRQTKMWRRVLWLGLFSIVTFGVLSVALPSIYPLFVPSSSALGLVQLADGVFPFSYYRYTFFSPTVFTLRLDFLGQPPAFAAILLTPLLIPFLRKDLAARYLFVSSIGLLLFLYFPPVLQFLESRMSVTILRMWNWNPKALVVTYFLPHLHLIVRDAWSALRQHIWNGRVSQAAMLLIVLVVLLAGWSPYLRRDWPPVLGPGHALPNGAQEMLQALRDHTTLGESATVLAWRDITDAIPAYRATLMPVLFREDPKGRQRQDADRFFGSPLVTETHLEILNRYQVRYLILSGDREIISQCDLLPEYFQPLYRNAYGTLYRVALPLESNALIEANTIANYGEWEGAIEAYNAVLAEEPNSSLAHTGLGIILQLLGKPKAAARELEAAISAAPTNAQAHYHLVQVYRTLGMDDRAAQHIQGAGSLIKNGSD